MFHILKISTPLFTSSNIPNIPSKIKIKSYHPKENIPNFTSTKKNNNNESNFK